VLDRRSEAWCREMFGRWLAERGIRQFGTPLDHGDESGAAGFEVQDRPRRTSTPREPERIDQGHWRGREAVPRRGPASSPVRGPGHGSGLPDRKTPVPAAGPVGRLRPVADGGPGEPLAGADAPR